MQAESVRVGAARRGLAELGGLCPPQALVYSKNFELVICDEAHRIKVSGVGWGGVGDCLLWGQRMPAGGKGNGGVTAQLCLLLQGQHGPRCCTTWPARLLPLHLLQNGQSKITQAIAGLPAKLRLLLTGTPIQNDLSGGMHPQGLPVCLALACAACLCLSSSSTPCSMQEAASWDAHGNARF